MASRVDQFKIKRFFCFFKNYLIILFSLLQLSFFPLESTQTQNNPASKYTIVFIHIGNTLPSYIDSAVRQARLFNRHCRMILVANQDALNSLSDELNNEGLETISSESLRRTLEHEQFCNKYRGSGGFWFYTSERFLYIYDLMVQYQLHDVFHLENDNMLYADLEVILPLFQKEYQGIAASFDNDNRCIAGFIYIHTKESMKKLAAFMANSRSNSNDMEVIAQFRNSSNPSMIDNLPIIHKEYINEYPLKSACGFSTYDPYRYSNHVEEFAAIFDAAAIGQYLGGTHINSAPGFINESCLFNPSLLKYVWQEDSSERRVPYAVFEDIKYPIINLHIHSKELWRFSSK